MDDDWCVDCSDDEFRGHNGSWEPSIEEIDRLYTMLENNEIPELEWKSPGYKSPTPEIQAVPTENLNQDKQEEDKSDFDFMDEVTLPKLKMRKDGEDALKGSAKKKTTSLDGVINNMRRHKLLPAQSKDT
ncbi:hypothetical protein Trydic_g15158 [Trypoxylus dichotomus]